MAHRAQALRNEQVMQFVGLTGIDEKVATKALRRNSWRLELALDDFFQNRRMYLRDFKETPSVDRSQVKAMVEKYKDKDGDAIGPDGVQQLCDDLGVAPEDVQLLVLAWKGGALSMGVFSVDELTAALVSLGASNIDDLKTKLKAATALALSSEESFKSLYHYTFDFGKEPTQKSMAVDYAVALWQLLLKGRFALLDVWTEFFAGPWHKGHNT